MSEVTLSCNGCSNSVVLVGDTAAVEASCGQCGYRMTPDG
jgi:ribosomal protein S27E